MAVIAGPARYFYLRKAKGQEDIPNWPPAINPLEGPDSKVLTVVRLIPDETGWRAEGGEGSLTADAASEPALALTRRTALVLMREGRPVNAEVGLVGVRVINRDSKGVDYASHLVVQPLAGLGGSKPLRVVPIDALVLGEYVEQGARAEAGLDLRLSPSEFANMPPFVTDDALLRTATAALDRSVFAANAYNYGPYSHRDITVEVEAGRVSLHGRAQFTSTGDQARAVLLETPGVVEVSDHILYVENLKPQVEDALAAKGLDYINVLVEHALIILRGETPDSATRYKAEDIAKRIPGVRGVVNDLVVRAAPVQS